MSKEITLLSGATGINNVVDPARLKFSSTSGLSELAYAVNVEIDETGRINRRKGTQLLTALQNAHSLFEYEDDCFVVADGNLYRVNADYTLLGLRSGMSNQPLSFAGVADKIYYSSNAENGYIDLFGLSYPWAKEGFEGPLDTREYVDPPKGQLIHFAHSRMYVAQDKTVWYSEDFAPSLFRNAKGYFPFLSRVCMLVSVDGGIFVGTDDGVYFIGLDMAIKKVNSSQPYLGSSTQLPGGAFPWLETSGVTAIWSSGIGVCIGTSSGQVVNITENNLLIPGGYTSGATVLRDDGFLVASMF